MDEKAEPGSTCNMCGHEIDSEYSFCPGCGAALRDQAGNPLSEFESALAEQVRRDRNEERDLVHLWKPATGRIYLFAILMFSLPDAILLLIFKRYVHRDLNEIMAFLMIDVVMGLITIFLVRLCARRGPTGELIMSALRMGQVSLIWSLRLMPFEPVHDILNLLLFALLPLLFLAVASLVFRFHLTRVMDFLSRPLAE